MKTETEKLQGTLGFSILLLAVAGLSIIGMFVYQILKNVVFLLDTFV